MKVNVRYFATLREIIDTREEQIEIREDSTMRDLLDRLVELHGPRFKDYVIEGTTGMLRTHLVFLISGTSMNGLEGLGTRLAEGCTVALMPPVIGG